MIVTDELPNKNPATCTFLIDCNVDSRYHHWQRCPQTGIRYCASHVEHWHDEDKAIFAAKETSPMIVEMDKRTSHAGHAITDLICNAFPDSRDAAVVLTIALCCLLVRADTEHNFNTYRDVVQESLDQIDEWKDVICLGMFLLFLLLMMRRCS